MNKKRVTGFFILLLQCLLPLTATCGMRFEISNVPPGQSSATLPTQSPQPRDGNMPRLVLGLEVLHEEFKSFLLQKHSALQQGRSVPAFKSEHTLAHTINESVVIDALANAQTTTLVDDLIGLGAKNISHYGKLVSAVVPINMLPSLANLTSLRFARPSISFVRSGSVISQGDTAMDADYARSVYGIDGSGVTVGVLSDSYDCLGGAAAGVGSGDLPATVNVLLDDAGSGCSTTDEGRAMLEIVHDMAPGAALAFHTANLGEANFAQGILDLANNANADVIVDDVIYLAEPMFQDGVIAQAVDSVGAQDISYFSSVGNNATSSYEADYRTGTSYNPNAFSGLNISVPAFAGGISHDFSGTGDDKQQLTLQPGANLAIVLQWRNAYPSLGGPIPNDDLDVYLLDPGNVVVAASTVNQGIGADPVEIFSVSYSGSASVSVNLMIVSHSQTDPGRIKYVLFGNGFTIDEYHTYSGTGYGHANAAHARAVGAAYYKNTPAFSVSPPTLESFSSRGGVPIFFDPSGSPLTAAENRPKPEMVAPDGVNTTFFYPGSDRDSDGIPNFSGTSAAAPHAGAVAALLKNAKPGASAPEIYTALQESAIDMSTVGFDFDSGFGLIQASSALEYILSQDNLCMLGFSSLANAAPLQPGDSFISTEYIAQGVTINDNGDTPADIDVNAISGEIAGIKGNFIQVGGDTTLLTLTLSPPVNHVEFDFASTDGTVNMEAFDALDNSLLTTSFSGSVYFTASGFSGLAGHASVSAQTPITKVVIDAAIVDNLKFGNVPIAEKVPMLPATAYYLMLLTLLGTGLTKYRSTNHRR